MFAPYCPTCESRILLGTGRIVSSAEADGSVGDPLVQCYCGTIVQWDAAGPTAIEREESRRRQSRSENPMTPAVATSWSMVS